MFLLHLLSTIKLIIEAMANAVIEAKQGESMVPANNDDDEDFVQE